MAYTTALVQYTNMVQVVLVLQHNTKFRRECIASSACRLWMQYKLYFVLSPQPKYKIQPVLHPQPTGFGCNTGCVLYLGCRLRTKYSTYYILSLLALDAIQRLNFVLCFSTNTTCSIFIVLESIGIWLRYLKWRIPMKLIKNYDRNVQGLLIPS